MYIFSAEYYNLNFPSSGIRDLRVETASSHLFQEKELLCSDRRSGGLFGPLIKNSASPLQM